MRKKLDATSLMSERHHWCRQDPPAQKKCIQDGEIFSVAVKRFVWVCLIILWAWRLKG